MVKPPSPRVPLIGELRWPVTVAWRKQDPSNTSSGINDGLQNEVQAWASIEATRPLTYYAGAQVDTPATHIMRLRWMDWLDTTHVIIREMRRPDGTVRQETFRIRRIKEIEPQAASSNASASSRIASDPPRDHSVLWPCLRAVVQPIVCKYGQRPHGQWLPWLEREFGWSAETANRYMRVAESFKIRHADGFAGLTIDAPQVAGAPSYGRENTQTR
jgi:hypothetical protein